MAQDLELRQRTALRGLGTATEPELDQFMVSSLADIFINRAFFGRAYYFPDDDLVRS